MKQKTNEKKDVTTVEFIKVIINKIYVQALTY